MKKDTTTLTATLQTLLQQANVTDQPQSVGTVVKFGDGVAQVAGLDDVESMELLDLGKGSIGLALNLTKDTVGVVALTEAAHLKAGDLIHRTGRVLSIGVSEQVLGRTLDPIGNPVDGGLTIKAKKFMNLEKIAPGVMARKSVTVPLQTGIKAIDAMIPIGRGQRELIIGDRSTGKTSVALGAILNQADQDVVCVYVCIGQKRSSLAQITQMLQERGAMEYTTIVAATASDTAAQRYLAPYAGQAIAEYFLDKGKDVLIIFDDLTKHAQAYREISLLLRRPSGREAYPGDVFYLHSRLLERACRLNEDNGGGSITALPIIETQAGDVSAYIPTNVISITDGQIYLETDLFNAGMKPAINVGLSVSRVGSAAQVKAMKQVAGTMKLDLAQYRELEAFAQFSSDLDERTKAQLNRGEKVFNTLKQGWDVPLKVEEQVVVIFASVNGYLDAIQADRIQEWEKQYLEYVHSVHAKLLVAIATEKVISEKSEKQLHEVVRAFNELHGEFKEAA